MVIFALLVRFSPQHQIFQQKRLYSWHQAFLTSSCNLILFNGENCLFHMEHFSLLKLLFYKLLLIKTLHK